MTWNYESFLDLTKSFSSVKWDIFEFRTSSSLRKVCSSGLYLFEN